MTRWPAVRAYKQRTYELLGAAAPVLDVGCGPGIDVAALGIGRCIGIDRSQVMATTAAERGVVQCRMDAHELGFRDGAFTGLRADRVVQHLAEPERALQEMARVVAPGGRVVISDPDQESLVIQVPGVRQSVLDRVKGLRRDVGYRNGRLITRIPSMLGRLGVRDVSVEPFPLVIRDPTQAFGLPTWPSHWRERGRFTDDELREWDEAMGTAAASGFVFMLNFVVVAGTVGSGPAG